MTTLSPDAFDTLLAHAKAALQRGDHRAGAEWSERALAAAAHAAQAAEARELWAVHSTRIGQLDTALREGRLALRHFESVGLAAAQSRVHTMLALAYLSADLPREGLAHGHEALRCARVAGDAAAEGWALSRLAMAHQSIGEDDTAHQLARDAVALARRARVPEALFATLNNRGQTALNTAFALRKRGHDDRAEIQAALADGDEAMALARASGNALREALSLNLLGEAKTAVGHYDEAQAHLQRAIALTREGRYRVVAAHTLKIWARLMQACGRPEAALEAYSEVLADAEADSDATLEALRGLYRAHRDAGRVEQAFEHLERLHALQQKLFEAKSDRRLRMLTIKVELDRAEAAAERAQHEAELQRVRAEEADRTARLLARERDALEGVVQQRTAELAAAKEAAEASNRAKSVFLAHMSHELRTPLNGMLGLTELALRRATDPVQADRLRKSLGAAEHLRDLIGDILDISSIESGHLVLQPQDFDLAALLEDVPRLHEPQLLATGRTIEIETAAGVPPRLRGDARRITQILVNFVSNAIKFSERGPIALRASAESDDARGVRLRFEVADQGIGIDAQAQAQLFQPFTQLDASPTRRHGGSGLGLAIARLLARRMGGDTGLVSRPGEGSTFWATVLLQPAAAPAVEARPETAVQRLQRLHAGRRVLLVEDNPVNELVAVEMLGAAGLVVDVARDGAAGVDRARTGAYALVLMDLQLPVMGGLDAARAIRGTPGLAQVPIVALTADAFDADRAACLAAGMDDHIAKPVDWEAAYARIERWLRRADD